MPRLPSFLSQEIATIGRDITIPVYGGNRLYPRDETLLTRGGGGWMAYDIYTDLAKDTHAYAVLQKRYMEVVGREWEVKAASESAIDVKAADLVREQLQSLATRTDLVEDGEQIITTGGGFDSACWGLLNAILYGFYPAELMWGQDGKEIYLDEIRLKDLRRFTFIAADRGYKLRLLTHDNPFDGLPIPPRKFLVHRFASIPTEDPHGLGIGTRLFYPVYFKRNTVKFWLTFADKWATPTAVAKHPRNASQEQRDRYLDMLHAISSDAGIAIPEDVAIEFLEAQRSGTIDCYKGLVEFCNGEMSKCVLGETGGTDQSGSGGSRARDEVGERVRLAMAKLDADLLSETLNRTLIPWIVQLNLPDAKPPKIWRKFPELESKFDRTGEATIIVSLTNAGFKPTREWVAERFDIELEPEAPAAPANNPDAQPDLGNLFGGGDDAAPDQPTEDPTDTPPDVGGLLGDDDAAPTTAPAKGAKKAKGTPELAETSIHPRDVNGRFTTKAETHINRSADAIVNRIVNLDKIKPNEIKAAYNRHGDEFPKALLLQHAESHLGSPHEWDPDDSTTDAFNHALVIHAIGQADTKPLAEKLAHGVDLERLRQAREQRGAKSTSPLPTVDIHQATKGYLDDFEFEPDHAIDMAALRRQHGAEFGKEFLKSRLELGRGGLGGLARAAIDQLDSTQINNWLKEKRTLSRSKDFGELEFAAKKGAKSGTLKQCKKGYSCGYSCISKTKQCRSVLEGQAKNYANWLAGQVARRATLSGYHQADAIGLGLIGHEHQTPAPRFLKAKEADFDGMAEWEQQFSGLSTRGTSLEDSEWVVRQITDEITAAPTITLSNLRGVVDSNGRLQSVALIAPKEDHIYVDYLATAPWNIMKQAGDERVMPGSGRAAIIQVVQESIQLGKEGRVRLHSLLAAHDFYTQLGFEPVAKNSEDNRLQLSAEAAQKLLAKYGGQVEFMEKSPEEQELDDLEFAYPPLAAIKPRPKDWVYVPDPEKMKRVVELIREHAAKAK